MLDPSVAKNLANEFQSNFYLFVCNPQADATVKSSPNIFTLKGVENLTDISITLTSAIRSLDPFAEGAEKNLRRPRFGCSAAASCSSNQKVADRNHCRIEVRWLHNSGNS
ncbi:MAG: hypothetical protein ABR962_11795 [Candidatus Bathyarchaeia archaeon]